MANPFDYVNDASYDKKNLMRGTEDDKEAEKGYSPWLTNLAFSQHQDTILHANLMNLHHELDNRPQYEFYINSIRPKKRYAKWAKKQDDEELNIVCKAYGVNPNIAKQYLSLLSVSQMNYLKEQQEEGGIE